MEQSDCWDGRLLLNLFRCHGTQVWFGVFEDAFTPAAS